MRSDRDGQAATLLHGPEQAFNLRCQPRMGQLDESLVQYLQPLDAIQPERPAGGRFAIQSQQIPGL